VRHVTVQPKFFAYIPLAIERAGIRRAPAYGHQGQGIRRRTRWRCLVETAMSDELNDPLFERLGPLVLRLLAYISLALIVAPVALVAAVPFFG
jgi:hypothetical protein